MIEFDYVYAPLWVQKCCCFLALSNITGPPEKCFVSEFQTKLFFLHLCFMLFKRQLQNVILTKIQLGSNVVKFVV